MFTSVKRIFTFYFTRKKLAEMFGGRLHFIGGPASGYMLFGRSARLEEEREGSLAMTDRAVHFSDVRIPSYKSDGTRKGHFPNSILLLLDNKREKHSSKNATSKPELKTDDVEHLGKSLRSVREHPSSSASPVRMKEC